MVAEVDVHSVAADNISAVSAALEARGVDHVLVPTSSITGHRVAVSAEDADKAIDAIASALDAPEWGTAPPDPPTWSRRSHRGIVRASATKAVPLSNGIGVRAFRLLVAENGEPVAGLDLACHIDFWRTVDSPTVRRPDGGMFAVGTRLCPVAHETIVNYLSPSTWRAAVLSPEHWPAEAARATLFQVREPVDIVYTWVDGSDPDWVLRKSEFCTDLPPRSRNMSATHDSRYISHDELKYSLRSVAMYASWVNKIYIVTDRQAPNWLNTSHPKIEIVDHTQIFSDPSALPVFNSHAIESQLHHIPGLAEQYLYLNDDVFFGRPVEPELFFHGNGVGKFFLSKATLDLDPPSTEDLPVMSAAKRNRELITQRFDATVIHKFKHTPHTQLRSVLERMELEYPDVFAAVQRSRFRHPDDLSITSALHHYYAYGISRSMPGSIQYMYQDIARRDTGRRLSNLLRNRTYDAFCLNDHETDPDVIAKNGELLAAFFERYFPLPSPYELPEQNAQ